MILLYSSLCFIFSSPQCNNTCPVNLLSVFFSRIDLSLILTVLHCCNIMKQKVAKKRCQIVKNVNKMFILKSKFSYVVKKYIISLYKSTKVG